MLKTIDPKKLWIPRLPAGVFVYNEQGGIGMPITMICPPNLPQKVEYSI